MDLDLRADCSRCFALCCIAPAFTRSADFAIDKPADTRCPNLLADHRCGIHGELRERGFKGCTVFDCFGAGQQVSQVTFGGVEDPLALEVFPVMRLLHELLWLLDHVGADASETLALTRLSADELLDLDVMGHRIAVNDVLTRISAERRAPGGAELRGEDLVGMDLRQHDLVRANLRGALLIGADLRGVDLTLADVTGADLRGADLRGADLREVLWLTRSQIDSAIVDETCRFA